jgi:hypothetical protein
MGVGAPAMDEKQTAVVRCFGLRRPKEVVDWTSRNGDDVLLGGTCDDALKPNRRGSADFESVCDRRGILYGGVS